MPLGQIVANPLNAFPTGATPPIAQPVTTLSLPNQDTVALTPGTLVAIQVSNNVVGVVRSPTTAQSNANFGVVINTAAVGALAEVAISGIVQVNVGSNAVTAGHYVIANATNVPSAGKADDGGASGSLTAAAIGTVIGTFLTSSAANGTAYILIKPC